MASSQLQDTAIFDTVGKTNPKNWDRIIFLAGRALQSRELNEVTSIQEYFADKFGRSLFRNGQLIDAIVPAINVSAGEITIPDGRMYIAGKVRDVPGVGTGSTGEQADPLVFLKKDASNPENKTIVGIRTEVVTITEYEDESLLDPAGFTNFGLPGAYRQIIKTTWVATDDPNYTFDEASGDIKVFVFNASGVLIESPDVSTLANIDEILELRTYEESGHYKVRGFSGAFSQIDDPTTLDATCFDDSPNKYEDLLLDIDAGLAYVRGRRIDHPGCTLLWRKARDTDNDLDLFSVDSSLVNPINQASGRIYAINHSGVDDTLTGVLHPDSGALDLIFYPSQQPLAFDRVDPENIAAFLPAITSLVAQVRTPVIRAQRSFTGNDDFLPSSTNFGVSAYSYEADGSKPASVYASIVPGSVRVFRSVGAGFPTVATPDSATRERRVNNSAAPLAAYMILNPISYPTDSPSIYGFGTSTIVEGTDFSVSGDTLTWLRTPAENPAIPDPGEVYYVTWAYDTGNGIEGAEIQQSYRTKKTRDLSIGVKSSDLTLKFGDATSETNFYYADANSTSYRGMSLALSNKISNTFNVAYLSFPYARFNVSDVIRINSITQGGVTFEEGRDFTWRSGRSPSGLRDTFITSSIGLGGGNTPPSLPIFGCGMIVFRRVDGGEFPDFNTTSASDITINYDYWEVQNVTEKAGYFVASSYLSSDPSKPVTTDDIMEPERRSAYLGNVSNTSLAFFGSRNNTPPDLLNAVDFRRFNSDLFYADAKMVILEDTSTIRLEYDFFLPRMDRVVLTRDGSIEIREGVSSPFPSYPSDNIDELTLMLVSSESNSVDPNIVNADVTRSTMVDINTIRRRVESLEYQVSLNALERNAENEIPNNIEVTDSFLRNGLFVDPLEDFSISDLSYMGEVDAATVSFNAAIDVLSHTVRLPQDSVVPSEEIDSIFPTSSVVSPTGLGVELSSGIYVGDKTFTLAFTEVLELTQSFATQDYFINPSNTFFNKAFIKIDPSSDWWVDEENPYAVVSIDESQKSLIPDFSILDMHPPDAGNVNKKKNVDVRRIRDWWTSFVFGIPSSKISTPGQSAPFISTELTIAGKTSSGLNSTPQRTRTYTNESVGFTPQSSKILERTFVDNIGNNHVVGKDIILGRREKTISIEGYLFPPNTTFYCVVSGRSVNIYPSGFGTTSGSATSSGYTTIKSSPDGRINASITLNTGIPAGASRVTLISSDGSISAETTFMSGPHITRTEPGIQAVNPTIFDSTPALAPTAQTFIPRRDYLLSSIELFFKIKPSQTPGFPTLDTQRISDVVVEIRETVNGLPSGKVLATSVVLEDNINTSEDASSVTKFAFIDPPLLLKGLEYAIVVRTRGDGYVLFAESTGGTDINTGEFASGQVGVGTLFDATNGTFWSPRADVDLKFNVYRASPNDVSATATISSVNLNADSASVILAADSILPRGASIKWEARLGGGIYWVPITPFAVTKFSTLFSRLDLRCTLSHSGKAGQDVPPIITKENLGVLGWVNSGDDVDNLITAYYISDSFSIRSEGGTEKFNDVVVMYDVHLPPGTSVTPYVSLDSGLTWNNLFEKEGDGNLSIKTKLLQNDVYSVRVEAKSSGTSASPVGGWRVINTGFSGSGSNVYVGSDGYPRVLTGQQFKLLLKLTSSTKLKSPSVSKLRAIVFDTNIT